MNNLSAHFSYNEGVHSDKAVELGLNNFPSAEVLENMTQAAQQLEIVRSYLAQPVSVDSWYRSPEVNAAVGGVSNSAHLDGWAIDFTCSQFGTPEDIVKFIVSTGVKFDQCIVENNSWVHISFAPAMRQRVLSASLVNGEEHFHAGV